MSANAEVLRGSRMLGTVAQETALPLVTAACDTGHWNPEDFAREQIRALVRLVFFAGSGQPARHVVFSAAEQHIDVAGVCDQVARALALETRTHVALVDLARRDANASYVCAPSRGAKSIKSCSVPIATNLWRVPSTWIRECDEGSELGPHRLLSLQGLRKEFEYAVIQGPPAGISSDAALLGQLTDGLILVLDAGSTRRATARKIKQTLDASQCRILGTMLTGRTFPIPERLYRCL